MLRILANENVPGDAIEALRRLGHDVVWAVALILAALQSRSEWSGYFSVVENDRIRMTPLRRREH